MGVPVTMVKTTPDLAFIAQRSRRLYATRVAGMSAAPPWWTAVVITASSARQAERYRREIHRRAEAGKIPADVEYLVVADRADQRIGNGGATVHALRSLVAESVVTGAVSEWWAHQRVF